MRAFVSAAPICSSVAPWTADADVLANRRREDVRVLPGDGEHAANVLLPVVAQVHAVEHDPPRLGIEEAQQQIDDCRLAGSARADQGNAPARHQLQARPRQRRWLVRRVASRRHRRAAIGRVRGAGAGSAGSRTRRLTIDELEDATARPERRGQLARSLRERIDSFEGGQRQEREGGDRHSVEAPAAWAATAAASTAATVAPMTRTPSPSAMPAAAIAA